MSSAREKRAARQAARRLVLSQRPDPDTGVRRANPTGNRRYGYNPDPHHGRVTDPHVGLARQKKPKR